MSDQGVFLDAVKSPGVSVLPRWRVDVLSFVAPGAAGYRLLVCGLAVLAGCAAFRDLDAPLLTAVEWHAVDVPGSVPGQVHLTYTLPHGETLRFMLEAADADDLLWTPGERSGRVRVRVDPLVSDLTDLG